MARATMRGELRREDLQAWIEGKNAQDRAWWRWPVGLVLALWDVVGIVRDEVRR